MVQEFELKCECGEGLRVNELAAGMSGRMRQARLRRLLRMVPEYDALLTRYPEATIVA